MVNSRVSELIDKASREKNIKKNRRMKASRNVHSYIGKLGGSACQSFGKGRCVVSWL